MENNNHYPFVNLPLPYEYSALEPYIDEKTMRLHHDKHLQTYINNLNDTLKNNPQLQKMSLEQLIKNAKFLPPATQVAVRNNAGGVYNHRFFFNGLINPSKQMPTGSINDAINSNFGGFEKFKMEFKKAALSVFGSGYAWLVMTSCTKINIVTSANQNTTIENGFCPIIAIDVWEHAYYLKHYNVRADYIDDWFKIINWDMAQQNYNWCLKNCMNNRFRR